MIVDVTGVVLTPGDNGRFCLGNGKYYDENGEKIECCCDECSYMLCCLPEHSADECKTCTDGRCEKAKK